MSGTQLQENLGGAVFSLPAPEHGGRPEPVLSHLTGQASHTGKLWRPVQAGLRLPEREANVVTHTAHSACHLGQVA